MQLSPQVRHALADMGFQDAMPIQERVLPAMMEGRDVIGQARTGTGKTAAFGVPLVEKIDVRRRQAQALVLCPTRELCQQITRELNKISHYKLGARVVAVYGGEPIQRQIEALRRTPQIVVGTPGRLLDHVRRGTVKLDAVSCVVIDEADEMLQMGFQEQMDAVMEAVPGTRQTALFSATMTREVLGAARRYQKGEPVRVSVDSGELTVPQIAQYYVNVTGRDKTQALVDLLREEVLAAPEAGRAIVFCNMRARVEEIGEALFQAGLPAAALHGEMRQVQRERVMNGFRRGAVRVLVASDVAARGIDVSNVSAVLNYDLPQDVAFYVHRIGRTARAGRAGVSYSLVSTGESAKKLLEIERFTRVRVAPMPGTEPLPAARVRPAAGRSGGGRRASSGRASAAGRGANAGRGASARPRQAAERPRRLNMDGSPAQERRPWQPGKGRPAARGARPARAQGSAQKG